MIAPSCPKCGQPLTMLQKYQWAPSIAYCPCSFPGTYDVLYDYDAEVWNVLPSADDE